MSSKLYMLLLCEKLFLLGMQAQSHRMYQSEGFGFGLDGSGLDKAIKENQKDKKETIDEILDILQTFGVTDERTGSI